MKLLEEARDDGPLPPVLVLGGVDEAVVGRLAALFRPGERWGVAAIRAFQDLETPAGVASMAARMKAAIAGG